MPHLSRPLTAAVLAGALVLGSACSGDDDSATAASGTIPVTAVDYGFTNLPDTIQAGATLTLANSSEAELHELVAIRLPDDEDRSVEEILALPPEDVAVFFPLVTTVIITPPTAPEGMVVEGSATLTEPGRYAFLCAIPTGADPDEYLAAAAESEGGPPDVAGGPPHFVQGMWAEVRVVDAG